MSRLNKISEIERHDQVVRNIQAFYAKKQAENPDTFYSNAHIQNAFSNFAGMNRESRFREHFPEIFDQPKENTSSAGRDNTFVQEHEMVMSKSSDDFIKSSSLQKVKKIVDASLAAPEYTYNGYVKVKNMGDSGFANWNVKFATARGYANISVPVTIVDGYAYDVERFFTPEKESIAFNKKELYHYASNYSGSMRKVAEQKSGLTAMGQQAVLTESQIDYQNDVVENNSININYSIPISEEFTAKMDVAEQSLMNVINRARQEVEMKLSQGDKGTNLNLSVNLSYSGALPYTEEQMACETCGPTYPTEDVPAEMPNVVIPVQTENVSSPYNVKPEEVAEEFGIAPEPVPAEFQGIIAFNIKNKTRNGMRIATIPVEVLGKKIAVSNNFFGKNGIAMKLDALTLTDYLNSNEEVVNTSDEERDAFSDAFLASDMSLNQLRKEMKQSIDSNNIARANACLGTVASRFGQEAVQSVTKEYLTWVREATDARNNENTCIGCAFFASPRDKRASHTMAFCNKLSTPVTQVKRGSLAPSDCERRIDSINWDTKNDNMYDGDIKTSSIVFSQSYE